jgi:UDP-N-acetylmuramoyl-L-alanyl-D-glutamate--2,6-diaminopimelate ligase
MLGEAAAKHFDICIVTDEEASVRPTADMRNAIISGYKKMKYTQWHEIPNRGDAIKKALSLAKAGDSVTIIPQGNLTSRTFYGKTFTWDDREVAAAALEAMGYTQR